MDLILKPVEMTVDVMNMLEERGVLRRLYPDRDRLPAERGESRWVELYAADSRFGPHKLIAVTINSTAPSNFVYHSDAEDFMLLGPTDGADLILTVSLLHQEALNRRLEDGTVTAADFMAVRCRFNDPETSFFTMSPHFAHVETCSAETDRPPSFYVSESRNLDEQPIDLRNYRLIITW